MRSVNELVELVRATIRLGGEWEVAMDPPFTRCPVYVLGVFAGCLPDTAIRELRQFEARLQLGSCALCHQPLHLEAALNTVRGGLRQRERVHVECLATDERVMHEMSKAIRLRA